jgi:hypothetical protein
MPRPPFRAPRRMQIISLTGVFSRLNGSMWKLPRQPTNLLKQGSSPSWQTTSLFSALLNADCGKATPKESAGLKWAIGARGTEQVAHLIEAMVVADYSSEEIAQELGTDKISIEAYETFFFDVRPYLQHRAWLKTLCFGKLGHRALQIAFNRGYAGVEEVVLRRKVRNRDLKESLSVLLGRVEDAVFEREDNNVAPTKMDLEWLLRLSQISALGQLPCLQDIEREKPLTPKEEALREMILALPFASQERIACALDKLWPKASRLAIELIVSHVWPKEYAEHQAKTDSDKVNSAREEFETAVRSFESKNGKEPEH